MGKNGVEVIVKKNGTKWSNEKHIEEKLEHTNLRFITLQNIENKDKN